MAQHDYVIANGTGAAVRSDLNNALSAIVSNNSGATEPTTTYAYMWWPDTSSGNLKLRNGANNAWITIGPLATTGFGFLSSGGTLTAALGSASTPGITFTGDLNTGIYSPGADQVAISTNGTGRLFVDSSGRVGVGRTPVAYGSFNVLDLAGSAGAIQKWVHTGSTVELQAYASATLTAIGSATNHPLVFTTNDTERMRLTATGLGIGTTSDFSSAKVVVDGGGIGILNKGLLRSSTDGVLQVSADPNNAYSSSAVVFDVDGTERFRCDASGRLLVGTSTSRSFNTHASALQIDGDTYSESTVAIVSNSNTSEGAYLFFVKQRSGSAGGSTVVQNNDVIGEIRFNSGDGTDCESLSGQIQCRVDGTPGSDDVPGRLVFSVTQDGSASPTERLRVSNNGTIETFQNAYGYFGVKTAGTDAAAIAFMVANGASSTVTGTARMVVREDGDIENTNNSYGSLSDVKLKENIVDATPQWADIKALQVRKYNFKEETGHSTHTQIGLVAQEVELVSPGLVSESPDRDAEGNDLGTVTKSVNYSVLYMKAVKALQEAMERIETLEAKVAALETA